LQRHVNKSKVQKKLTLLPSSLVIESFEQHSKWLMLSLVTSVTLRGKAPYTRVKTQGAVDIPQFEELLRSEGVDIMRAWVAANDSDCNQQMTPASLSQTKQEVQLIRSVLLSLLNRIQPSTETNPTLIDTVLLKRLRTYCHEIESAYDKLEI
jgi:isoleucyl-tRNA synthetase